MGKRCFAQSTWIGSKDITFKKKKKKKKKKKACKVENSKGRPRQKLRQKNPARLKIQKGVLGKR